MWALTDFTEANGATRLVPGCHRRRDVRFGPDAEHRRRDAAGDVLVWHGSLWHGGGANRSAEHRVGIAMNYCAGYIRQQENQQLGIPLEVVAGFAPPPAGTRRLRRLPCLIGHIDKRSRGPAVLR